MNYSNNPLAALMQMRQQTSNPLQQLMQMGGMPMNNRQPIDHNKFIQASQQMNEQTLAQLASYAKQQGISDQDIEKGLDFLLELRK